VRLPQRGPDLVALVRGLMDCGLGAIEVFHSEHSPADCREFAEIGRQLDLIPTGGTDYHGDHKPGVKLGTGIDGNVCLSYEFLDTMRTRVERGRTAVESRV
jgi:hypothetical protein